jgi:glycosyltransferase involved in cell wall biosynthesis
VTGADPDGADPAGAVRAALLLGYPVQHFAPGLRLLAARPEVRPRVYYWSAAIGGRYDPNFGRHIRWSTDLHTGYDWWAPPADRPVGWRGAAVWRRLWSDRPEVVVCFGWASPVARLGIAYAAATRTPLLYYGDTSVLAPVTGRHPRLRVAVLRLLFRRAAGAISTGTFNRYFYLAHGMCRERVHPGVYPTDVAAFAAAAERRRSGPGTRPEPGTRPLVIGFAGKLTAVKAPGDLLEAAARLPREPAWELRLIGDGPLRPRLAAQVAAHGLADRVRFLGFRNTDELPDLMSEFDILVMPSRREPRGLVPIEAMAAGAAVVVSSATGVWGPGDAVHPGRTGLVYPAGNVGALAATLRRLLDDEQLRHRLAAAGRVRAGSFGPPDFAATVAAALVATACREVAGVRGA